MFWHGLIDHSNIPGRRLSEFTDLCNTVKQLDDLEGSIIQNQCAILYSSDQEYALKNQPQSNGFHYYNQIKSFHHAFSSLGIGTDIINQYADFTDYRIIVAPTLYITEESTVKRLYEFTRNGGTLILTNRSGVKDFNNNCIMEALPTVFRELVGAYITEYDAIGFDVNHIKMNDNTIYEITQWCDIIETETAEILATYSDQFYEGKAAVTRNTYGTGTAYYVGTIGKKAFYKNLVENVLQTARLDYIHNLPEGMELTIREKNNQHFYFLFNNTEKHQNVEIMGKIIESSPFEMHIWRDNVNN
jgi:beta-galactosidase